MSISKRRTHRRRANSRTGGRNAGALLLTDSPYWSLLPPLSRSISLLLSRLLLLSFPLVSSRSRRRRPRATSTRDYSSPAHGSWRRRGVWRVTSPRQPDDAWKMMLDRARSTRNRDMPRIRNSASMSHPSYDVSAARYALFAIHDSWFVIRNNSLFDNSSI